MRNESEIQQDKEADEANFFKIFQEQVKLFNKTQQPDKGKS